MSYWLATEHFCATQLDKILSRVVHVRPLADLPRFIALAARAAPTPTHDAIRKRTNGLMKARGRGPFFIGGLGGVRAPGITYPWRCRECVTRDARCYLRDSQVARTRALCVPRCLKSFPISCGAHYRARALRCTVAGNTPCHCSRIRLSDELASGLAFGPDCLGFPRSGEKGRESYSIPERRLEPNHAGEKGIWETGEGGIRETGEEGNELKDGERDQRVVLCGERNHAG